MNLHISGNDNFAGEKADVLRDKLFELPNVLSISKSSIVTSLGRNDRALIKYTDPNDSIQALQNVVDEHYLALHDHVFLAGSNFRSKTQNAKESEVIVNENLLKRFNIATNHPSEAIGKVISVDGNQVMISGVLKDFHYERVDSKIKPVVMRYSANPGGYLNVKIASNDWVSTMEDIGQRWMEMDKVHPLDAVLYNQQIEKAFSPISMMVKVIGFLAFLAICISSMGLFGMVVFTTETKIKEISIRKVLGAGVRNLIYMLSKNLLWLLVVSALVAIPITFFLFDKVILVNFAYHSSIGFIELFAGLLGVMVIAFAMVSSQTFKAARINPAETLRNE